MFVLCIAFRPQANPPQKIGHEASSSNPNPHITPIAEIIIRLTQPHSCRSTRYARKAEAKRRGRFVSILSYFFLLFFSLLSLCLSRLFELFHKKLIIDGDQGSKGFAFQGEETADGFVDIYNPISIAGAAR